MSTQMRTFLSLICVQRQKLVNRSIFKTISKIFKSHRDTKKKFYLKFSENADILGLEIGNNFLMTSYLMKIIAYVSLIKY